MQPRRAAGYLLCTYVAVALRSLWVKCMHANVSGGVRIEWRELLHASHFVRRAVLPGHANCVSTAAVFFGDSLRARCTHALHSLFGPFVRRSFLLLNHNLARWVLAPAGTTCRYGWTCVKCGLCVEIAEQF